MKKTTKARIAEHQRLKGNEKDFDQMRDMPWTDGVGNKIAKPLIFKGLSTANLSEFKKITEAFGNLENDLKTINLQEKYNQLRKDNIRLSRDYDECKTHNGKMCDDNITLEKTNSTHLHKIYHLKNEVSAIAKRERKLIAELEEQKLEIEDYKKTIKSFESYKNIKGKNYLVWYLFVAFALLFGLIVFAAEYIVFK